MITIADKQYFLLYLCQRIRQNKNVLMNISGSTGSGKSYSAAWLGEKLQDMQGLEKFDVSRICFKASEFIKLINSELPRGSVIIFDEAGVSLYNRNWMGQLNKILSYLLQTFRFRNYIVIFTVPSLAMLDSHARALMHVIVETERIDHQLKRVALKPLLQSQNQSSGKLYRKYLRYKEKRAGLDVWTPFCRQWCYMPSQELIEAYEAKKKAFCSELSKDIEAKALAIEEEDKPKEVIVQEPIPQGAKPLTARQRQVYPLWKKNLTQKEIAKELGVTRESIGQTIRSMARKGWK